MPTPRTLMLMQCVGSPGGLDDGKWWLAETYLTSDGPRMRVIPCPGMTEAEARAELSRREAIVAPLAPDAESLDMRIARLEDAVRRSRNAMDASSLTGRDRTSQLLTELMCLRGEREKV